MRSSLPRLESGLTDMALGDAGDRTMTSSQAVTSSQSRVDVTSSESQRFTSLGRVKDKAETVRSELEFWTITNQFGFLSKSAKSEYAQDVFKKTHKNVLKHPKEAFSARKTGYFLSPPHHQNFFRRISENLIANRLESKPESFNFKLILRVIV